MRSIFPVFLLPGLVLLAACGEQAAPQKQAMDTDTIPVRVMPLNLETNAAGITVSGQFTTDDETFLSFKTGGIINSILVKEGDAIRQGQVLATLNLTEINAQVQQAKLAYEKAVRDHQRASNLYKDSVATLEQLQNSETAMKLAQQQLGTANFNRSYSEIRAPHNGYVLHKLVNPGQLVQPGTPVFQTNGAGSASWLLRVGVSDREWASLQLNDPATIETTALPGQKFTGVVSRKSEGVDAASGTFVADIRLTGQKPAAIAAGMFGKAVIKSTPKKGAVTTVWTIPYEALLDGDGSTGYVFVTNDNKTAHRVAVRIVGMQKDKVLIGDGLQQVQSLIISGSAYLKDNSFIVIRSSSNLVP